MIPIALLTVIGGKERAMYLKYWTALCRSMKLKAPGMSCPWFIVSDKFTKPEWAKIKKEYPNAIKHLVDLDKYTKKQKAYPAFWSLEAANPALKVERMIALDADLLCDGDWSRIAYGARGALIHACKEPVRSQFGAAIIVVNRVTGYDGLYKKLLDAKHDGGWGTDQNIWNQFPIQAIENPNGSVERMAWPESKETCEHPIFWNLWGKTGGKCRTTPAVWDLWEKIMGYTMPVVTLTVSGDYSKLKGKGKASK